ncbi:hypothetical protein PP655_gp008 [Bacillus phage PBC4]|uniref:Uncharacterized protein n=1 Tax=Bacillus phage PBC4 TaxID=1675028 RepID=A0A1D6X847_9CAUD|nr:hypothetical protein PP655_gp008 [Bacillus phage PBC4]AKQ08200.1 hypothetical protein PBC4_008 [Bacillus phage PBC4]WEM05704.1 hypothetical protein BSG01_065 [Bacillus phage BSG01]
MERLLQIIRRRLADLELMDKLPEEQTAFTNEYLTDVLNDALDTLGYELPLPSKRHEQLIALEGAIIVVTGLKAWSDGESYSYKSDAVQVTRGLMPRHFKDTIALLNGQKNEIIEGIVMEL